jgi:hypothetical protein
MEGVSQVSGEGTSQRALAEMHSTDHEHHAGPGDVPQLPGPQCGSLKQEQQKKLLGPINWDRYLPVKTLKVLLVENCATRQIVTALLRNCGYEGMFPWSN